MNRISTSVAATLLTGVVALAFTQQANAKSPIPEVRLTEQASVWDNLPAPTEASAIPAPAPETFTILRGRLTQPIESASVWTIGSYGYPTLAFADGVPCGRTDSDEGKIKFPPLEAGTTVELFIDASADAPAQTDGGQVIIEADGNRIDFPGTWRYYTIPATDYSYMRSRPYSDDAPVEGPVFYRGSFTVNSPAGTWIDLSEWGKGVIFINGQYIGVFRQNGGEKVLPIETPLLKTGENEIIILDVAGAPAKAIVRGADSVYGNSIDLSPDMLVASSTLECNGQYVETEFKFPVNTRYIAIEFPEAETAAVADIKVIGPGINRITREKWRIADAGNEQTGHEAPYAIDGDISTYWLSSGHAPHKIVIDMGANYSATAVAVCGSDKSGVKPARFNVYAF